MANEMMEMEMNEMMVENTEEVVTEVSTTEESSDGVAKALVFGTVTGLTALGIGVWECGKFVFHKIGDACAKADGWIGKKTRQHRVKKAPQLEAELQVLAKYVKDHPEEFTTPVPDKEAMDMTVPSENEEK